MKKNCYCEIGLTVVMFMHTNDYVILRHNVKIYDIKDHVH